MDQSLSKSDSVVAESASSIARGSSRSLGECGELASDCDLDAENFGARVERRYQESRWEENARKYRLSFFASR